MEIRHSKLIILWGTNTKLTNRHLWPTIEEARADGAQVIVIDPIRTMTADAADWFIQPLPGTDIALMLAMMHVLIRDELDRSAVGRRSHAGLRRARRPRRRMDARARRGDLRRGGRRHRAAGDAVRHHPPGRHPHADRRRAPRERGDVLPHARLPAGAGRCVARPRRRTGPIDRRVDAVGGRRRRSLQPTRSARRSPTAVGQHEPSRRDPHATTSDPPINGLLIVWNCNPLVIAPNAEKIRAGVLRDDLFTVVHEQFITDTARYADIVLPATTQIEATDVVTAMGPPLAELERGRHRAVRRGREQQRAVPPPGRGDGLHRARAVRRRHDRDPCSASRRRRRRVASHAVMSACRTQRTAGRSATAYFPTPVGRVEFVSEALVAMGQPALPTFVAAGGRPDGSELAARYPLQLHDTQAPHPLPQRAATRTSPGTAGARAARSSSCRRPTPPAAASATATASACSTTAASIERAGRGSATGCDPASSSIPLGWWSRHHPDGMVANSLTNDTLTEWGGGVAFYDTLVRSPPRRSLAGQSIPAEQARGGSLAAWQAS